MTALCTHRRALKTAPIEFSESTTEKDCHCIRNNGEWPCSRPIGVNFSKHITRSHGDLQTRINTQRTEAQSTQRETLGTNAQGLATSFVAACAFAPVAGALGYKDVPTGMREVLRIEKPHP